MNIKSTLNLLLDIRKVWRRCLTLIAYGPCANVCVHRGEAMPTLLVGFHLHSRTQIGASWSLLLRRSAGFVGHAADVLPHVPAPTCWLVWRGWAAHTDL